MAEHRSTVKASRTYGVIVTCLCGWEKPCGHFPEVEDLTARWLEHQIKVAVAEKEAGRG